MIGAILTTRREFFQCDGALQFRGAVLNSLIEG
jgi:hypothetical protein